MPKKPSQSPNKPMTLDRLAAAIRDEFSSIRRDIRNIATKSDLNQIRKTMATKRDIADLRADIKIITDVMVSKHDLTAAIQEEIGKSEYAREMEELINRIEEKLGIEPARR